MNARRLAISLCAVLPVFAGAGLLGEEKPDDGYSPPVMFGAAEGWRQKVTGNASLIEHTGDGGRHWSDVSPPALTAAAKELVSDKLPDSLKDLASLGAFDGTHAWLSLVPENADDLSLEYTEDAGRHWKQTATPLYAVGAYISFVDKQHGFLLAISNGNIFAFYSTANGGERWYVLPAPAMKNCKPSGISFRSATDGWMMTAEGSAAPLYRTSDGGNTWKPQTLKIPAGYRDGWVAIGPPRFRTNKNHGYLPVELRPVGTLSGKWVNYETNNGGATWHPPKTSPPEPAGQ